MNKRGKVQSSQGARARHVGIWYASGFSLLELMIVVAVIAILSAIAIPSYLQHVTKTNRVAAEGCLSEFSNYMERAYTSALAYPTASSSTPPPFKTMDCAQPSQTGNNYSYGFASASSTAYILQAVPINAQLKRDTKCGTLTLDQTGKRSVGGTGTLEECW